MIHTASYNLLMDDWAKAKSNNTKVQQRPVASAGKRTSMARMTPLALPPSKTCRSALRRSPRRSTRQPSKAERKPTQNQTDALASAVAGCDATDIFVSEANRQARLYSCMTRGFKHCQHWLSPSPRRAMSNRRQSLLSLPRAWQTLGAAGGGCAQAPMPRRTSCQKTSRPDSPSCSQIMGAPRTPARRARPPHVRPTRLNAGPERRSLEWLQHRMKKATDEPANSAAQHLATGSRRSDRKQLRKKTHPPSVFGKQRSCDAAHVSSRGDANLFPCHTQHNRKQSHKTSTRTSYVARDHEHAPTVRRSPSQPLQTQEFSMHDVI
jgi:hypothetical protein